MLLIDVRRVCIAMLLLEDKSTIRPNQLECFTWFNVQNECHFVFLGVMHTCEGRTNKQSFVFLLKQYGTYPK